MKFVQNKLWPYYQIFFRNVFGRPSRFP